MSVFSSVEAAADALARGGMVIIMDDEDRENEGDLVAAAAGITARAVNFMAARGRGLICVALAAERARALGLGPPPAGSSLHDTAFTESVDLREGVSTGISAADRAATIRALATGASSPGDFARPGHVFPLVARPGGVLERRGQTEASVDLCAVAGLPRAAVICEVMRADGEMARRPELGRFAAAEGIPLITVEQLARWRKRHEALLVPRAAAALPCDAGEFRVEEWAPRWDAGRRDNTLSLRFAGEPQERGATAKLPGAAEDAPLVRVHSECLTGEVFGSRRCDCGWQLAEAMRRIAREGRGAVLYLRQEGRGIGLSAKLRAYALQEGGLDTYDANLALGLPADARDYWEAAQVLRAWGWGRVRLLSNNPEKARQLEACGIAVVEMIGLEKGADECSARYIAAKRERFGHLLGTRKGESA